MRSGVVFYKYEAHKEYDDVDVELTAKLGTIKICRYHFEDKRSTLPSNTMPLRVPPTGSSPFYSHPLPKKDTLLLGLSLQIYPMYTREAIHTWSLPSPSFGIIASSKGWMYEDDED
ncbi:hypothetical protein PIB30_078557 [Stylosanthes scabra]|uniref:Uncharacterized protein n=1 Tax=Stylosanthes scabra TaxID=79078 RepID=A0ABU6WP80_9FABA|nr:hypothetical protein [Stylosanthes scabra]